MKIKSNSVFVYVRIKLLFASSGSAFVRDREKEPLYVQNFLPTLIENIIEHMFWLDFVFTLFLCFFLKGKLGVEASPVWINFFTTFASHEAPSTEIIKSG